jgi:carnitine O-palmitoyltransferase 1
VVLKDLCIEGYTEDGNCKGEPKAVATFERLKWELDDTVQLKIGQSLQIAQELIDNVEMSLLVWTEYGKGFIKRLKISPDAFLQMTLQLTYFRVNHAQGN